MSCVDSIRVFRSYRGFTNKELMMPLKLEDKQAIVAEVNAVAASSYSAIVAEYSGITVEEMTGLRAKAREAEVYLKVVKNTLARRAVEETGFACLKETLVGPVILAFSKNDPGSAARVISEFSKTNKKIVVKGVALSGKLLAASDLEALAKLPTKEQAISQLMSVIKAPITKFVQTLREPHAKMVRTFAAVRDSKEAPSESPAA
jgi:large subunit ribosomal protein L10